MQRLTFFSVLWLYGLLPKRKPFGAGILAVPLSSRAFPWGTTHVSTHDVASV